MARKKKKPAASKSWSDNDKETFLEFDLRDALKYLLVGAVIWNGHPERTDHHHLRALGMFMNVVQARALYEFFFKRPRAGNELDSARAYDFSPSWNKNSRNYPFYKQYIKNQSPANKRVFHLVYSRTAHSGGPSIHDSKHLKNQVLNFANELLLLTKELAGSPDIPPKFQQCIQTALDNALQDAQSASTVYVVGNPFN